MLSRFFAVALVALLLVPVALASAPAAPSVLPDVDRYVYAELALAQPDLTTIDITGRLWIYRHDVEGRVYDADEMGSAYRSGGASGAALVAALEAEVRARFTEMLRNTFPDAQIADVVAQADLATLRPGSGNPYDPPVEVAIGAKVTRTKESAGLGALSDHAVATAFAAGARVRSDLLLAADPGYRVAYTLQAPASPAGLRFAPGPGVSGDGAMLFAEVDNSLGESPTGALDATLYDPSVAAPTAEDVRMVVDVTMGAIASDAAGIPIATSIEAEVRALDVRTRFPGALPQNVVLPYVSADGIRALKASGALNDSAIARANEALLAAVRADLTRAFGGSPTVTGGLSSSDLAMTAQTPYDVEPPLRFAANALAVYAVPGATGSDIDLALRIGGAAEIDLALFAASGRETTFTLHPPPIGEFTAAGGGALSADGTTATFVVPAGSLSFPATLTIRGKDIPEFAEKDAQVAITVDLKDLDIKLGEAMGGDFGDLLIDLSIEADLRVIEVPDALKASLPEGLDLDHISSDAIRLLVQRGKIDEADLVEMEQRLLDQVERDLGAALGGSIPVEGGLERGSLAASLVATPIRSDTPIVFSAHASVVKPLAGGEVQPQAAIALYSRSLPLTLPKIEGFETVYTVILPRGMSVSDLSGAGGDYEASRAPDGREQFTVRPTQDEADITATMAVTPTFVMVKFWPLVLLAVILVVLVIGTPVALITMKRRKAKGKSK